MSNKKITKKPAKKIATKKETNQSLGLTGSDRFWVFTINNYNEENIEALKKIECGLDKKVRALQCQGEKGKQGTKHIQGLIIFNKQQRRTAVMNTLECETVHLERMKTTEKKNVAYTSKSETYDADANIFIRTGIFNMVSGERSDIKTILDKIDQGMQLTDILVGDDRETYIKNSKGIESYYNMKKRIDPEVVEYMKKQVNRPWQDEVEKITEEPVSDRKIVWIPNPAGNIGKTFFMNKKGVLQEKTCFCMNEITTLGAATDNLRNWINKGNKPKVIILNFPF